MNKQTIIAALRKWLRQRPGLEFGNYGDVAAYRSELRGIGRDLRDAETMLRAIEWRDSITGDAIVDAAKHAFSGRLKIEERADGRIAIDYSTGQYWPTEYRRAVCAVLSSVLWDYWCADIESARVAGSDPGLYWRNGLRLSAGDYLRQCARSEFGIGIARRWFR